MTTIGERQSTTRSPSEVIGHTDYRTQEGRRNGIRNEEGKDTVGGMGTGHDGDRDGDTKRVR